MNRRQSLASLAAGTAALSLLGRSAAAAEEAAGPGSKFRHSVCRWCFNGIPLETLCTEAKAMGIASIELLGPSEWPKIREAGLACAIGMVPPRDGIGSIPKAFNRPEHHDTLFAVYSELIPLAAKHGVTNLIAFSGNRGEGIDDETGMKHCEMGLKRLMPLAEQHGVTISMELLNSRVDHAGYMCDRSDWGAKLVDLVGSERFKLLYDIYHMQIMEGDVIATFRKHKDRISHFHTAGVPGRHEIDDSQELNYRGIARALNDMGYTGFLGQEFMPKNPKPLDSLRQAVEICTVKE